MTGPIDLDALEALERRAKDAPWQVEIVRDNHGYQYPTSYQAYAFAEPAHIASWAWAGKDTSDIDLCVALRNHARALIAEARRAREYREALVRLIDAHGDRDTEAFWHVRAECVALLRKDGERG